MKEQTRIKKTLSVMKKLIDKKHPKQIMRYAWIRENGNIVAADNRHVLFVDMHESVSGDTKDCLLDLHAVCEEDLNHRKIGPYGVIDNDISQTPDLERTVPKNDARFNKYFIDGDSSDMVICQIAHEGYFFDTGTVNALFSGSHTHCRILQKQSLESKNVRDHNLPFSIEGTLNGFSFKLVILPHQMPVGFGGDRSLLEKETLELLSALGTAEMALADIETSMVKGYIDAAKEEVFSITDRIMSGDLAELKKLEER